MPTTKFITTKQLRYSFPEVRAGLQEGKTYVLLYRGNPVGVIKPPDDSTEGLFFQDDDSSAPKSKEGKRLVKNTLTRKRKRGSK